MTRNVKVNGVVLSLVCWFAFASVSGAESRGTQIVQSAARSNQFAFIMFYRGSDTETDAMYQVLKSTLSERKDAAVVPIQVGDKAEAALVKQFDATRIPLPAVAVLAPNGAVCSVMPRRVSEQQLLGCIVSPGQAECLKALQGNQIVALCALPSANAGIPAGVREFQADKLYKDRTQVVTVLTSDPNEAKFLEQLRVPTTHNLPAIAFMAPPGVMIGVFNASVTGGELAQKLAAAGKCCDDENCKHHKAAAK